MTTENDTSSSQPKEPAFLSSLPDQPITDDVVKQIGESDNELILGAMGFPGATPGKTEAFLVNMATKTHVLVFDANQEQWRRYASFENAGLSHDEMVNRASELYNEWLAESLSDRIAAGESESDDP